MAEVPVEVADDKCGFILVIRQIAHCLPLFANWLPLSHTASFDGMRLPVPPNDEPAPPPLVLSSAMASKPKSASPPWGCWHFVGVHCCQAMTFAITPVFPPGLPPSWVYLVDTGRHCTIRPCHHLHCTGILTVGWRRGHSGEQTVIVLSLMALSRPLLVLRCSSCSTPVPSIIHAPPAA